MLQCVAVCCSVLQRVDVIDESHCASVCVCVREGVGADGRGEGRGSVARVVAAVAAVGS